MASGGVQRCDTGAVPNLTEICDYRRRAFEFISQAIKCEETRENESLAESLYKVMFTLILVHVLKCKINT